MGEQSVSEILVGEFEGVTPRHYKNFTDISFTEGQILFGPGHSSELVSLLENVASFGKDTEEVTRVIVDTVAFITDNPFPGNTTDRTFFNISQVIGISKLITNNIFLEDTHLQQSILSLVSQELMQPRIEQMIDNITLYNNDERNNLVEREQKLLHSAINLYRFLYEKSMPDRRKEFEDARTYLENQINKLENITEKQ